MTRIERQEQAQIIANIKQLLLLAFGSICVVVTLWFIMLITLA